VISTSDELPGANCSKSSDRKTNTKSKQIHCVRPPILFYFTFSPFNVLDGYKKKAVYLIKHSSKSLFITLPGNQ